jgi:putative DeoR family transcriptional regulator (stage III sporulation protein D)
MKTDLYERAVMIAQYIIETGATVREAATHFALSKSTVHKDLTDRLKAGHSPLYPKVAAILEEHLEVRHIRGGAATKAKFAAHHEEAST